MSDLVDFLLARQAERLEEAHTIHEFGCPATFAEPDMCHCGQPEWVRADVEAKRRIIAQCAAALRGETRPGEGLMKTLAVLVLEDMVGVYASHPEYQQEWAP